jgi:hypothetical protein
MKKNLYSITLAAVVHNIYVTKNNISATWQLSIKLCHIFNDDNDELTTALVFFSLVH